MNVEAEDVAEVLTQWLESFVHRSMHGFIGFVKERGLSMPQMGALLYVSRRGTCGVSDIGDDQGVTNAAASQTIDRLVHQGFVVRNEDPKDRRAKRVELTPTGRTVVKEASEARRRWFIEMAERMSADERRTAVDGLRVMIRAVGNVGEAKWPPQGERSS